MGVTRQLHQLQGVDLELESAQQALQQITGRLGESQAVVTAQSELKREKQHLEELQRQQHTVEWEMDDLTTKLAVVEEKLYSGRINNPKELANLQHEADGLKARRGKAEDRALEIMEQVSAKEARVSTLGGELGRLQDEWQQEQHQLEAEGERYGAIILDLEKKRQQLLDDIDSSAVKVYQDVTKRKGRAVATVEQGICRGCQISLPITDLQRVRSGSMMRCTSCGRILFLA